MSDFIGIGAAAKLLGLSTSRVRQLSDAGVLTATTSSGGHRRYDPETLLSEWQTHLVGQKQLWSKAYPLSRLDESHVWADVKQVLPAETTDQARDTLGYAVTEMVNNAIDHSGGTTVIATVFQLGSSLTIVVVDDGVGAFLRMKEVFGLPNEAAAVVEITKGKRTTSPDKHSGEGIFFTSKAVDVFELSANGYTVIFDNTIDDVALQQTSGTGTRVVLKLSVTTVHDLVDVFREYMNEDGDFDRSTPRIELVTTGGEFLSRSEARRFAAGLEKFDRVVLDFTGVKMIGQGFADELFRVWHKANPSVILQVRGTNPAVDLMINRV